MRPKKWNHYPFPYKDGSGAGSLSGSSLIYCSLTTLLDFTSKPPSFSVNGMKRFCTVTVPEHPEHWSVHTAVSQVWGEKRCYHFEEEDQKDLHTQLILLDCYFGWWKIWHAMKSDFWFVFSSVWRTFAARVHRHHSDYLKYKRVRRQQEDMKLFFVAFMMFHFLFLAQDGQDGRPLTRRSAVRSPLTPVRMLECPWARPSFLNCLRRPSERSMSSEWPWRLDNRIHIKMLLFMAIWVGMLTRPPQMDMWLGQEMSHSG